MSLSKQTRANRKNAKKSTGPKTVEGKQISSKNAMKFGITSSDIVIDTPYRTESQEQYDELLDNLKLELKPHSAFQDYIVKSIADSCWRYRRVIAAETARVTQQLRKVREHPLYKKAETPEEQDSILRLLLDSEQIPYSERNYDIRRYERQIHIQIDRAYRLLNLLQTRGQERYAERLALKLEKKARDLNVPLNPPPEPDYDFE